LAIVARPRIPVHGVTEVPTVTQLLDAPADTKVYSLPAPAKAAFITNGLMVIALMAVSKSTPGALSRTVRMTVCAGPTVSRHIRSACTGVALRPKSAAAAIAT